MFKYKYKYRNKLGRGSKAKRTDIILVGARLKFNKAIR